MGWNAYVLSIDKAVKYVQHTAYRRAAVAGNGGWCAGLSIKALLAGGRKMDGLIGWAVSANG